MDDREEKAGGVCLMEESNIRKIYMEGGLHMFSYALLTLHGQSNGM